MFYSAWGFKPLWFCRTGVLDSQNAGLEAIFEPQVPQTRLVGLFCSPVFSRLFSLFLGPFS